MYPQKSTLSVGADADLVIGDPKKEYILKNEEGYSKTGFTIFDGWKLTGKPILTMRRGEIVFRHNKIQADPGSGRLLKCHERNLL